MLKVAPRIVLDSTRGNGAVPLVKSFIHINDELPYLCFHNWNELNLLVDKWRVHWVSSVKMIGLELAEFGPLSYALSYPSYPFKHILH